MRCPEPLRFPAALCVALLLSAFVPAVRGDERPNILFVFADDLGQRDLGCYGSPFYETPHVDAIAERGVRFTNAYAACPVCSPTRASVYTGQYPARLPLTNFLKGLRQPALSPILIAEYLDQLPLDQVTVAEELQSAGYRTGFVGKWHLGGEAGRPGTGLPTDQGFDVNVGGGEAGHPGSYFWPQWSRRVHGVEGEFEGQYLTDRLAKASAEFVTESSQTDAPWFLCVATYQVHTPIQAKKDLIAKYELKRDRLAKEDPRFTQVGGNGRNGNPSIPIQNNPRYAAMVESMDDLVGTVIGAAEDAGELENTLVVFFSDNGGLSVTEGKFTPATTNAPLRAGKGWLYEGGIREPLIVAGPGVARGATCDARVISNDLRATFLTAAGFEDVDPRDGRDLTPLLREPGAVPEAFETRKLYWHYPHYANQGGAPGGVVRDGDWKLIQRYEDGALELFNLANDPSERRNLAVKNPEKAEELRAALSEWRQDVQANMPTANPDFPGPVLER